MKIKLLALVLLVFGPFLAITSYQRKVELEKIATEGETVTGVIDGGQTRSRRGSKTFTFDVSFTTKAGAKLRQSFTGHGDFVDQHLKDNTIFDDRVQVRYLASDATKAVLVGNEEDPKLNIIIGAVLFPVGLVVAYFVFRKSKDPATAPADTPTAAA